MIEALLLVVGWMALVVVVVTWPLVPTGLRDAWRGMRDARARRRAVAALAAQSYVESRQWMRGDAAWHDNKLVRVAHVYPGRMLDVTDGTGFTYPVYADALLPFDDRRPRRAA